MTPRAFYKAVVVPNIQDVAENYGDFRIAHNAVASVDALAAHIYVFMKMACHDDVVETKDDIEFRHHLAQEFSDFGLIRDVAKAQKHVALDRGKPQVKNASQVNTGKLAQWDQGKFGEARFDAPPQVFVTTTSGEKRAIEALVKSCSAFLVGKMDEYGIG